jgi:hypothetical protein
MLTDITKAAGWQILDCDSDSADGQTIRLVCADADKNCEHLTDQGAQNKIIRLPESCGAGAFARVASVSTSQDQSLPKGTKVKRAKNGSQPQVVELEFDYEFDKVPKSTGQVSFWVSSSNAKGTAKSLSDAKSAAASRIHARDFTFEKRFGFGDIGKAIGDAAKTVGDGVKDAAGAVADTAKDAAGAVADTAKDVGGAVAGAVTQDIDAGGDKTSPIKFSQKGFKLISANIQCDKVAGPVGVALDLSVSADVDIDGTATYGLALKGTLVPPSVSDFGLFAKMTGKADVVYDIKAIATGKLGTGNIELFNAGLPGLSVPGIITVGPAFVLSSNAGISLSASVDTKIGTSFDLANIDMRFPKNDGAPSDVQTRPAPFEINLDSATVEGKGTLEAHLIPKLTFGVDVLGGKVGKADIFLAVDGFANTNANLQLDVLKAPTDFAGSVGGCVDANIGVSIDAGAEAGIAGLFNPNLRFNLFKKSAPVFKQCFGNAKRQAAPGGPVDGGAPVPGATASQALSCPIRLGAFNNIISTQLKL